MRSTVHTLTAVCLAAALVWADPCGSATTTYTVQSSLLSGEDSYLREDNQDEKNGGKTELRLKATDDLHNRHVVLKMPMAAVGARTVVQAYLRLTVSGASSATPVDARVYPLLESWDEPAVTWAERRAGVSWTSLGGTHGASWSGRATPSSAHTGQQVSWAVGPILQGWQRGTIPAEGFLIEADRGTPDREVIFRSSEYVTLGEATPELVIHATDEPPAIVEGSAEIQPRAIRAGATEAPVDLWLLVQASGATPSGAATGFDTAILNHGGQVVATGVDGVWVDGVAVPSGQVSWYDNGSSVTVSLPRVTGTRRVRIAFRARLLTQATSGTISMPVLLDDAATPGAWAQSLWAGNADGTADNGDDWLVTITNLPPVSLDLKPDTASVVSRLTLPLQAFGRDANGNTFIVVPDRVDVVPVSGGSATTSLFTAGATPGLVELIAHLQGFRDTSRVTVLPPRLPVLSQIVLRDEAGAATTTMVPLDSMRLDITLADGDGFRDITGFDIVLHDLGHEQDVGSPAFRAEYRWRRKPGQDWSLFDPVVSTWAALPGLSVVDTVTNATTPQTIRIAFIPGRIARASTTGRWTARVRVFSATPPDTSVFTLGSLNVAGHVEMECADPAGAFNPGRAGEAHLPLNVPAGGALRLSVVANTAWTLDAAASHMAGDSSATDTLFVGPPIPRVAWAFNSSGSAGGLLDTTLTGIAASQPPLAVETPLERELYLWIDHPPGVPAQGYHGSLRLRVRDGAAVGGPMATVALGATVTATGGAASSAIGEVAPEQVPAGVANVTFDAWMFPTFEGGDSGIDEVLVNLPPGYGTPVLTGVNVAGLPVAAADSSVTGLVRARLATRVTSAALVHVRFTTTAPTQLDSSGANVAIQYDDAGTPLPPQSAVEGDANGNVDGDDWRVRVVAGPVAVLSILPDTARCHLDSTFTFAAAATDAYGNAADGPVTWSVLDGIGTIGGSSGVFTGTVVGTGRVVAQSGSARDTATVIVRPVRGLTIREVQTPATAYQGQDAVPVRVRVENTGSEPVSVDSLVVRFRRGAAAADGDFASLVAPDLPAMLDRGDSLWLEGVWSVRPGATPGRITVDARSAAMTQGGRVADEGADRTAALDIVTGGVVMGAIQSPAPVRPRAEAQIFSLTLENTYPVGRRLLSLALTNTTSGVGDADQRDAGLGDVRLYRDDGNGVLDPLLDTLLVETIAVGGGVQLAPLNVPVAPGATARLLVTVRPPLEARDGDRLDLALAGPEMATFDSTTVARTSWPLDPPGAYPVDGMVAAQIALLPAGMGAANAGTTGHLALSVALPPNGYAADVLERLGIVNLGTARAGAEIGALKAWVDDGDRAFSTSDRALGALAWTGGRWELGGLAEPVPLGGVVVHVTVDLAGGAEDGRTIRLAIPAGAYPGIGMSSGNSGPLDAAVENVHTLVVTTADRLVFGRGGADASVIAPGARDVTLLHLTASNTYATSRQVTALAVTNMSRGAGTIAERDRAIERLELRLDGDDDGTLDGPLVDPVVGTGAFSEGRAVFTGLAWDVPSGATRSVFVTADVSLRDASDGDSLSAALAGASDASVREPSLVVGAWPVEGARSRVDGMVAAQLAVGSGPGFTLAPGDGPVVALDLTVPRNGRSDDQLSGLKVINRGTATPADVAELRMWRDGGDGRFDRGTGDDLDLGAMVPVAGGWQSALLSETVPAPGIRLFVTVTVSGAPADSATLRLAVPVNGVTVVSGNDGPRDTAVEHAEDLIFSTAPLLATISVTPRASTVGQSVTVTMAVRNAGGETVLDVRPEPPLLSGSATVSRLSGPAPDSLRLAAGAVDSFTWVYRSDSAGDVRFVAAAAGTGDPSGLTRRSITTTSEQHRIYLESGALDLLPVHSMPATVRAGQNDVVPFSLTFRNPGGGDASDARIERLRLRLESQAGGGIVPADLVERVIVNEGVNLYLVSTTIETSGSDLVLQLATPVTVTASEPVTVSVRLDLRDSTGVASFRAVIADAGAIEARDATSGAPVVVAMADSYPLRSGVARVVAEATVLEASSLPGAVARVSRGAAAVPALDLSLYSPGISGVTSDVRVHALRVVFEDTTGTPIARPDLRLTRLRLRSGAQILADRALGEADSLGALVALNPPLSVPTQAQVSLGVTLDVAPDAPLGALRLRLDAPATLDARDALTGGSVAVAHTAPRLSGGPVVVEARAETLRANGVPRFPAGVAVGRTGVVALTALLRHPHEPGTARIRVDSMVVRFRDEARRPLSPAAYASALHVRWNGVITASRTSMPAGTGGVALDPGAPLAEPGDTVRVEILIDVSPAAPAGLLELEIAAAGLSAVDANLGIPVRIEAEPGGDLPLLSGLVRLLPAARDLTVSLEDAMPAALAGDGREVRAARLRLRNDAPSGAGAITVAHLTLRGWDEALGPLSLGRAVSTVAVYKDGVLWAQRALTPDSLVATLIGAAPADVLPGTQVDLDIRMTTRTATTVAALRLGCEAGDVGVVQPGGGALAIDVRPGAGQSFPLRTEAGHFGGTSLAGSWSNFPNPFAAGREPTHFTYWLRAPGTITLRVWTLRNEIVRTVVNAAPRAAGLHQDDLWDGRNGAGDLVRNGAYVAEIAVRYDDGTGERLLRKVAVLR